MAPSTLPEANLKSRGPEAADDEVLRLRERHDFLSPSQARRELMQRRAA